jgi:hypothetical protein
MGEGIGELMSRSTMQAFPFSSVEIRRDRDLEKVLVCNVGVPFDRRGSSVVPFSSSRCWEKASRLARYPVVCVGVTFAAHVAEKNGSPAEPGLDVPAAHVAARVRAGGLALASGSSGALASDGELCVSDMACSSARVQLSSWSVVSACDEEASSGSDESSASDEVLTRSFFRRFWNQVAIDFFSSETIPAIRACSPEVGRGFLAYSVSNICASSGLYS